MLNLDFKLFYYQEFIRLFNAQDFDQKLIEVAIPVRSIKIEMLCPSCKTGYLNSQGYLENPFTDDAICLHECSNCDHVEYLINKEYPYVKLEPIND